MEEKTLNLPETFKNSQDRTCTDNERDLVKLALQSYKNFRSWTICEAVHNALKLMQDRKKNLVYIGKIPSINECFIFTQFCGL